MQYAKGLIHTHGPTYDYNTEDALNIFLVHYLHTTTDVTLRSLCGRHNYNKYTYRAQLLQTCWAQVLYSCQMAHQGQPVCCGIQYCVRPVHTALSQCCLFVQHAAPHPVGLLPASCFRQWGAQLHKQLQSINTFTSNFIHCHRKSKLQYPAQQDVAAHSEFFSGRGWAWSHT
jgi:hypothetical protein